VCSCLLEVCGERLLVLGDYLLRFLELIDGPIAYFLSSAEQLLERLVQFFTSSFPTSWPDLDPDNTYTDDSDPPPKLTPAPSRQFPRLGPAVSSSHHPRPVPSRTPDEHRTFDLPQHHSYPSSSACHLQHSRDPPATATPDWNPQRSQVARDPRDAEVRVTLAPSAGSLWPPASKTTATHVQSGRSRENVELRNSSSVRRRESDSCLRVCSAAQPAVRYHQPYSTSAADQFSLRQPSHYEGPVAHPSYEQLFVSNVPVASASFEQPCSYQVPVAPQSHEQRSVTKLTKLPVAPVSDAQRFVPKPSVAHVSCEQYCLYYQDPFAHQSHAQQSAPTLPVAPVNNEQRSVHRSPAAPAIDAQRSFAKLSTAPAAMESAEQLPRGLVNSGNACFVIAVLQSLGVIDELVCAIQRASKHPGDATDSVVLLIRSLSDVLSALHDPCGQSRSAVDPDKLLTALSGLQLQSQMIARRRRHQRQQDAAEFLACLFQVLRPLLSTPHDDGLSVANIF